MNKDIPLITIIIPIYNAENFLPRCINSILSQSMPNFELLCIEDGSADNSREICKHYASKDSRVKLLCKENGGEASARNLGMENARGKYIGFVDSDDWIDSRMYETLLNAIKQNMADISIVNYWIDYSDKSIPAKNDKSIDTEVFNRDDLLRYTFIRDRYKGFGAYVWNKLFRKSLLMENGTRLSCDTNLKVGDDVWFFSNLAMRINRAVYVDQCLYHYSQRPDSLFHQSNLEEREGSLIAYQRTIKLLEEDGIASDIIMWIKRFYSYHASLLLEIAISQKNCQKAAYYRQEVKRYLSEYIKTNKYYPERIERIQQLLKD